MSAQHRRRSATSPAADFAADHPGWVLTTALAVIAAVAALGAFFATTGSPTTPVASTAATASTNRLNDPAVRNYLGALFGDAGIGPPIVTAEQALFLGDAVCTAHTQGSGLYSIADHIRELAGQKLDSMQSKRLVDAADRNLCRDGKR